MDHSEVPKSTARPPSDKIHKVAIRLVAGVNDAVRLLIRYRGDLSAMAIEAIESTEVATVALVSHQEPMVRETTISVPMPLYLALKRTAVERGSSLNILINTALAYWRKIRGN